MRNFTRIAAVSAAALAIVPLGSAAQAATASANATAQVLSTLAVTKTRDLQFGQIAVNGNGNVVIGPDGTGSCPATIICTGPRNSAGFTVNGTAGVAASVQQASINLVHATDATKIFLLDAFTIEFPTGSTLNGGSTTFNVGGTLHVTTTAALAGTYTGTFNVNVEYQ